MADRVETVIAFLERDPLRHLVLLKILAQYPRAVRCSFQAGPDGEAALLRMPGSVSGFDRANYPSLDHVVFLAVSDPGQIPRLLAEIPAGCNLLFKLMDDRHPAAVAPVFPIRRVAAYHSFAPAADRRFECAPSVTWSTRLGDDLLAAYVSQGHVAEEVRHHFARGARAFTVYAAGRPVSTCYVYPNYGRIWEIGALTTAPACRRRGLARAVVSAVYHVLGCEGLTARYQADETNSASIRLAESIGLRRFLVNSHWLHTGRRP
jgi:ribosomal protein S18 acetylase RimI-like enzyme